MGQTRWRVRAEEVARLRVERGYRSEAELAAAAGMAKQQLNELIRRHDAGGAQLRSIERIADALSGNGRRVEAWHLVERLEVVDE